MAVEMAWRLLLIVVAAVLESVVEIGTGVYLATETSQEHQDERPEGL